MILKVTNLRTTDKDILSSSAGGSFFLDLDFEDLGGMEDDLGDVRDVSSWTV